MSELSQKLKEAGFLNMRSADEYPEINVIETSLSGINDIVIGCGGLPLGATIELYAPPSLGKTTLSLNWIRDCLDAEGNACFYDMEGTFPVNHAKAILGKNFTKLVMGDAAHGHDCLHQIRQLIALELFHLIVVDSIKALQPKAVADGATEKKAKKKNEVGVTEGPKSQHENFARAKMMSEFFQDIRGGYQIKTNQGELIPSDRTYFINGKETNIYHKLQDKATCVVFINHQMVKQGVLYGDKVATPGGDSGKFDASVRIRIKNKKKSKKKDKFGTPEYRLVEIANDKNKVGPPFRSALFQMMKDGRFLDAGAASINSDDVEDDESEE
jgi:RecA/RadA recombinase